MNISCRKKRIGRKALFSLSGILRCQSNAFLALLQTYGIDHLVDIRTIPRSRHNPQFNDTALANSLTAQHLEYLHVRALGGLRRARKDSPNTGWRNGGFRGYADYMQTEEFQDALEALIHMSRQNASRLCAPKRCRGDATVRL